MMTKTDMIDAITRLNRTAHPTFLAEFSLKDLQDYLDRLHSLSNKIHASPRLVRDHDPCVAPAGGPRGDRALSSLGSSEPSRSPATVLDAVRATR